MFNKIMSKTFLMGALLASTASFSQLANATVVQFQTSLGDFSINLYDEATPKTVANFLSYSNAGAYKGTFIHRSVPDFVIQGGGYVLGADNKPKEIEATASPINEPVFSNVRGTIAMAKLGGKPNSATNEWFINTKDNSANLDAQNGGFTVFGEVVGNGMDVVNAIAAVSIFNWSGPSSTAFTSTPLRGYTVGNSADFDAHPANYLVMIQNIVVLDAAVGTASTLTPVRNTLITAPAPAPTNKKKGGSLDWLSALVIGGLVGRRLLRRQ